MCEPSPPARRAVVTRVPDAPAEIDVLAVHEEPFVEAVELLQHRPADEQARTGAHSADPAIRVRRWLAHQLVRPPRVGKSRCRNSARRIGRTEARKPTQREVELPSAPWILGAAAPAAGAPSRRHQTASGPRSIRASGFRNSTYGASPVATRRCCRAQSRRCDRAVRARPGGLRRRPDCRPRRVVHEITRTRLPCQRLDTRAHRARRCCTRRRRRPSGSHRDPARGARSEAHPFRPA